MKNDQERMQLFTFQFSEDGIVRDGVGTLIQVKSGGMYVMEFQHSNIQVEVLPSTVKPLNLRKKIYNAVGVLVYCSVQDDNSGSFDLEDRELSREQLIWAKKNFKKWMKYV